MGKESTPPPHPAPEQIPDPEALNKPTTEPPATPPPTEAETRLFPLPRKADRHPLVPRRNRFRPFG